MPECYICGVSIPRGAGERRKLRTGTSVSGFALTSRPVVDWALNSLVKGRAVGIRNNYALRTVCKGCANKLDDRRTHLNKMIAAITIVALTSVFAFIGIAALYH